jgi:hypothetical protein
VDWAHLVYNRVGLTLVKTVRKRLVAWSVGNFSNSWTTVSYLKRILLRGVRSTVNTQNHGGNTVWTGCSVTLCQYLRILFLLSFCQKVYEYGSILNGYRTMNRSGRWFERHRTRLHTYTSSVAWHTTFQSSIDKRIWTSSILTDVVVVVRIIGHCRHRTSLRWFPCTRKTWRVNAMETE